MNAAHFHLVVNHLPVIFPIVGAMIMIIGFVFKSDAVKRTALFIYIMGSLSAIAAMNSGEEAEEMVENMVGIEEQYIENHEESAELFSILAYVLGGISIIGMWGSMTKKSFSSIILIVALVFSLVVIYFGKETGTSGGEIRHPEIRNGQVLPASGNTEAGEEEKDND